MKNGFLYVTEKVSELLRRIMEYVKMHNFIVKIKQDFSII